MQPKNGALYRSAFAQHPARNVRVSREGTRVTLLYETHASLAFGRRYAFGILRRRKLFAPFKPRFSTHSTRSFMSGSSLNLFPSEFSQLRGNARLVVYIDLKSPYAWIAIKPTREMASAAGVEIDWRPFTLDIPSYLGSAKLAKDGKKVESSSRTPQQWTGVKYAYRDARRYAMLTDKTLRGTVKIWDSSQAGMICVETGV